ncbi:ABC transporter substrate-binding protein [Algoriphagus boritolerans]|uniref:ABC-type branched-chain amino acid transport system, substrate-binding protein n=1 Tax=Algoriphagus boritolerans DSM 17298 = JCM 18970 TaxID=1120964 RepID=A0A1H5WLW0_9BACT|nr:ABC transporter substrate-binding protein [Algoriphagus boritolerans]SEG00311.1 ABC-type branched-chain amino acid transport system, substrate-binding protein [Algoriphagus boritolerans DSM 17298 = JCM 18970]
MRNLFLFLSILFTVQFSNAQGLPSEYQKAKSALLAKDYWEAMNGFKQVTDADKYGNLANYAAFHLAEAALGANQPAQAISALQPVYGKNWNKSDEAKYLLATAYFRNNQNLEALKVIKAIKKEEILQKSYNLTFEYLSKATASFLVANLSEFKANEGYAAAMAAVLQKQTIMSASEIEALNQVRSSTPKKNVVRDEVLDLVLILPFTGSSSASVSGISYTDFMFELFQGIEIGIAQLKSEGYKVNLSTFDSKRDLNHLTNLLNDPVIAKADVIIGPIYPEETDIVSAFAEKEQIPFIHPLSNLGERFEQFKYSYLFRPSVASLASGIISNLKSQKWGNRIAVGYSSSSRDEKLGLLLQAELEKSGFQLVKIQKVDSRNAATFLQGLGVSRGNNPSVDQVVLLSDDPAVAQSVFSLMESISTSVPLLVMDSWLAFNFANYEMLEFPNFYFISNNTPKFDTEAMSQFRDQFYKKYYAYPGMNSILGLELVYWLGSNSKSTFDYNFRRSLDQNSFQQGKLTWGFNFQNSNNNSYTPVFKMEAGELIPLK